MMTIKHRKCRIPPLFPHPSLGFLFAALGFLAGLGLGWAYPVEGYVASERVPGAPQFNYVLANLSLGNPLESRVSIYVAVANQQLVFRRVKGIFQAAYTISVVAQQDNKEIVGIHWRRRIKVDTYPATQTFDEFDLSEGALMLEPGRYRILIELEDGETHKVGRAVQEIEVRDPGEKLRISDVLFITPNLTDSIGIRNIVFPELGHTGDLDAYFEVAASDSQAVDVQWQILGTRGRMLMQGAYQRIAPSVETVHIPGDSLPPGRYVFQVEVKADKQRERSMRPFHVRHKGLIRPRENIDLLVEQLRYVADPRDWDRLMKAPTREKRRQFEEFWKQRDPTPDTPENELMEEYYTRVAYANQKFSAGRTGWRTDRGAVYIIYGPPDRIQRRTLWDNQLGQERYYEIWQHEQAARKFVFLYDPFLGDFRLVSTQ